MMFLWIPFLFLAPFAMMWIMRSDSGMGCCGMSHSGHDQTLTAGGPDPIEIARQRLARGEIDTTEYEEIRQLLV